MKKGEEKEGVSGGSAGPAEVRTKICRDSLDGAVGRLFAPRRAPRNVRQDDRVRREEKLLSKARDEQGIAAPTIGAAIAPSHYVEDQDRLERFCHILATGSSDSRPIDQGGGGDLDGPAGTVANLRKLIQKEKKRDRKTTKRLYHCT